jgi:hypothetical protein
VLRTVKVRDGELLPPLHYAIRAQDTDRMRPDGRAEAGPVVLPAEAAPLTAADGDRSDGAAQLAADVAAVVAAVAKEGKVSGKDTIWRLAGLPRERGRRAGRLRGQRRPRGPVSRPPAALWRGAPVRGT